MQRSSVDLPEPEGPIRQVTLPGGDREVDVLQRVERAVELVDRADLDGGGCTIVMAFRSGGG